MMNGVKIIRIPSLHSRYLFTFTAIFKAIKLARRHDVIQTTTFNGAPPAWLAGKITKKPVVITVHEVWIGKWKEVTGFSWLKRTAHDLLERVVYVLPYDRYVCVSRATWNDLAHALPARAAKKKTAVIYNGFDYDFWKPTHFTEGRKVREQLGAKDKFIYFSWGRPGTSKGFEYIIKAAPKIKEKIPHSLFLLMLGSIDKYQQKYTELKSLITKLQVQDHVKIIPSVPYEQLGNYIQAADCVIVPSLSEGFGYTALEAISLKKPVVISNAGSLPEVVSGKYQVCVKKDYHDLADKALKIARKEYLSKKMKKFEWKTSIEGYLNLYSTLLQDRRKNRQIENHEEDQQMNRRLALSVL
ncbi:glycosyltransferase family 4 protein [Candidatus Woesearchaeota archaeon]|nr:glycosyltransferase family 4 protein [Candidatus Woesearchaeota archaeon]